MDQLIEELALLPRGTSVLCAVSGGADSVCLLHALYRLRPRLGFRLAAAHYNHRLRGEEAERDARFVEQLVALCCGAQRLDSGTVLPAVPLYTGSGDVAGEAARRGTGVEETARDMRYAFLRQTARQQGIALIATAHNADDNVETVLFHLARGSGLRGLGGISPQGEGLIRPLLTTTRREIEEYLAYHGLPHMEDSSNAQDLYARNRLRHQVTPVLEELYPSFAPRLARTAATLREDEACLHAQAQALAARAEERGDGLALPADVLDGAPRPLAIRAARLLLARLRGGDRDCAAVHLEGVVRLCRGEASPSARLDLPGGVTARREYGLLVLSDQTPPPPFPPAPLALPGVTRAGGWEIAAAREVYTGQAQGPFDFYLDGEGVSALTVRPRQAGDRLRLPGRPEKSLKKWYIEEKIPRARRAGLPVLDRAGVPAAAAGLGPDARFLPQTQTTAWHIRLTERPEKGRKFPC